MIRIRFPKVDGETAALERRCSVHATRNSPLKQKLNSLTKTDTFYHRSIHVLSHENVQLLGRAQSC